MTLQSKSFLIYKGDTLETIAQFLQQEIGLNAFLIKTIKGVSLSNNVTQITLLFEKYSSEILDSIAPREGAIFTTGVSSDDFDLRFLFNDPIDFRSIQSGTFSIDGVGLDTGRVYLDQDSNNYFLKVSASGSSFQTDDFHTYQLSTSLKRQDGSRLSYTPVGGYVFHTLSNAHIGDYIDPYIGRRRGRVAVAVVRLSKGLNPQQGITEFLSQRQLSDDRLIAYTPISTSTNTVDVYFIYIDKLEPQIISGFPLNNSLLPDISAPGKVTFVFNTPLDKAKMSATTGLFSIEEGFSTSTNVPPSKVTLLDDLQTVEIDTSTYFTSQKIYSILARPGILGLDGLSKEKPEQWTIHIASYEGGATTGEGATGVSLETFNLLEAAFTGHTGDPTIHYTQAEIDIGTGQITNLPPLVSVPQFTGLSGEFTALSGQYAGLSGEYSSLSGEFTGHSGETGIHFTQGEISIPTTQIYNISEYATTGIVGYVSGELSAHSTSTSNPHSVTAGQVGAPTTLVFTGHTGETGIHYTVTSISHNVIQDIGTYTHTNIDDHINTETPNPHSVTAALAGAPTIAVFTGHTGVTGIHFTTGEIEIVATQVNSESAVEGYALTADGAGGASWTEITGEAGTVSLAQYNYLSGEHSGHVTGYDAHTGDLTIHFTEASINHVNIANVGTYSHASIDNDIASGITHAANVANPHVVTAAQVGSPTIVEFTGLSGITTGHTGDSTIHFTQAEISITESQVSDLGTYATVSSLSSHTTNTENPHAVDTAQIGAATVAQFTGHTGDSTLHYTEASIDHTAIQNIGTSTHVQLDADVVSGETHFGDTTIHFTEASIDHVNIASIGSYTHTQIDNDIASGIAHEADATIHFTEASIEIDANQINIVGQTVGHVLTVGGESSATWELPEDAALSGLVLNVEASGQTHYATLHPNEFNDLVDVFITNVADDHIIISNKGNYINTGFSFFELADLGDVTVSSPGDGEVLTYSSDVTGWINDAAGGAGATTLTGLTDTTMTQEYENSVIGWNTDSGAWTDMAISGSNGIVVTPVPSINALFVDGTNLMQPLLNLSDVNDLETARRNTKTRYFINDFLGTYDYNNTDYHNAGNSYQITLNSYAHLTGTNGGLGVVTTTCGASTGVADNAAQRRSQQNCLDLTTYDPIYFRVSISATSNAHFRFGLTRGSFPAEGGLTDGAYFEYNSLSGANWYAGTAVGSSVTKVDSNIAATSQEWKWFCIQPSQSGIYFYDADTAIDGPGDDAAFISSRPTNSNSECGYFTNTIANSSAWRHLMIDKIAWPIPEVMLPTGLVSVF
tara:strand:+ start:141882 stop:145799 length:3918 start_codon:yes stop_codon:yes gene_type:complete